MKTTLNKIRAKSPCTEGWKKLLAHLGKTKADDEALSIITILDSNGLDDALWCLRAVEGSDKEIRLYAAWCARQVQHLMTDRRSLNALDVAERYANGLATDKELAAASAAAWSAWSAADAWSAAEDAADAWSAAEDAARDAADAAGGADAARAAWSAADAAWSVAEDAADAADAAWAARAATKAAWAAAAGDARAAAGSAWSAAAARAAAGSAASDAADAGDAQEKRLREVCAEIDAALAHKTLNEYILDKVTT